MRQQKKIEFGEQILPVRNLTVNSVAAGQLCKLEELAIRTSEGTYHNRDDMVGESDLHFISHDNPLHFQYDADDDEGREPIKLEMRTCKM